jgi:hypothetical protein
LANAEEELAPLTLLLEDDDEEMEIFAGDWFVP